MSESTPQPSPEPITPEKSGGFFQNLVDIYFAPGEAFGRIVRDPRFLIPLVLHIVLSLAFFAVWTQNMDTREFVKDQIEQSPFADRIPADQLDEIVADRADAMTGPLGWTQAAVGAPVVSLLVAVVLLGIFRFFYGGDVRFKQAFTIVVWTFFAVALVTTPLMLVVMGLKGDWNLNPTEVLQANPTLLFDKEAIAAPLWALLGSLDLFSFWLIFLLATGFAVAIRKPTGTAAWGILIPWAILVALKVGWNTIF
jgi:hypothetical protein